jgi:hypothetical protein
VLLLWLVTALPVRGQIEVGDVFPRLEEAELTDGDGESDRGVASVIAINDDGAQNANGAAITTEGARIDAD